MADKARELLEVKKGVHDRRVSAILVSITKSETKSSYWGLIRHFQKHPEDLNVCELKRPYSSMVPDAHIRDRPGRPAKDHGVDGGR